ncbi:MAG: hypothetical protein J6K29_09365, partial [Clostridia bacterium]|nr:hypothetical protein [Clostridia bacterium]
LAAKLFGAGAEGVHIGGGGHISGLLFGGLWFTIIYIIDYLDRKVKRFLEFKFGFIGEAAMFISLPQRGRWHPL